MRRNNTTGYRGIIAPEGRHKYRANIRIGDTEVKW
jgi:hypothetical protein